MWRQLKNLNVDVPGRRGDKDAGEMPGKMPGRCPEKEKNAGKVKQATFSKVILQQALLHRYEKKSSIVIR